MFTEIHRRAIPRRYRSAVSHRFLLSALGQRQANRPGARIKSDEERETQAYDCSLYRLRPASHRLPPRKARARYDSRHSTRDSALGGG
jgi:hypothetical protein